MSIWTELAVYSVYGQLAVYMDRASFLYGQISMFYVILLVVVLTCTCACGVHAWWKCDM